MYHKLEHDIKGFLGRDQIEGLADTMKILQDSFLKLSEFGSRLLLSCLRKRTGNESNIPIMLFFRNHIELVETIATLLKDRLVEPCDILLRVMMETQLYLFYILDKDTERRALSFMLCEKYRDIGTIRKMDGQSEEFKQMQELYRRDKYLKGDAITYSDADRAMRAKRALVESPLYKDVNTEYLRLKQLKKDGKKSGKRISLEWYSFFDGPQDIQRLAEYLEMGATYDAFYRMWSSSVHGINILNGKVSANDKKEFELIQVRLIYKIKDVTQSCLQLSLRTYDEFAKKMIPECNKDFIKFRDGMDELFDALAKWEIKLRDD